MSGNVFIPKMEHVSKEEPEAVVTSSTDEAGKALHKVSQYAVVLLSGLLPIYFVPGLWASLGFDKVFLTIVTTVVVVIAASLSMLRSTNAKTILPLSLGLFWIVVLAGLISGILSGDSQDALRGNVMEIHTASFLAVLAVAMTIPLVLQGSKIMTIKALAFFGFTSALLITYNICRVIFGVDFLPFNSFSSITASPIGGFNDLAIFAGLIVILSLVTLVQLPLKTWLQLLVSGLVTASLILLAVVNFFNIWIVVGFFSLLMLIYLVSRDTLFKDSSPTQVSSSRILIVVTALVCVVSAVFIVAGDYLGTKVSDITNVNYVEVRPSIEATINIARAVYHEDALLGVGPNRFADAWRLHKDQSINSTIFWDTDFNAGSGFVPTLFVTTGLLGGILLVLFHLCFLYLGYRMLLKCILRDSYWYYFGVVSFTAACFLWGMSYAYVPGAGLLLLAALFTGFTFVAAGALLPTSVRNIPLAVGRQRGFFLMAVVIVLVSLSVSVLFSVGKQYSAYKNFSEAKSAATSAEAVELAAQSAYQLYPDEGFISAQAQVQLANMNSLLGIENPTETQQQEFMHSVDLALKYAEKAVAEDLTNPDYYAVLSGVYGSLALAGVDGASERAATALSEARRLDPLNPGYDLITAQLAARTGDMDLAREKIASALKMKRDFTQALYLSAQLDISEGKTESAIATTRSIISLEPQNPTRYFQLGVLLSAVDSLPESIAAFQAAIALDPEYANARYLLALAYLNNNQSDMALEQLRVVARTNPDNQQLLDLIRQIEAGEYQVPEKPVFEELVGDVSPGEGFDDAVTADGDIDTDLVTPVNTVSGIASPTDINLEEGLMVEEESEETKQTEGE